MRELHQLADQPAAERLASFLSAKSISCQVEAEDHGWTVWIHRDEQREAAVKLLNEFLADPNSPAVTAAIRQPSPARATAPLASVHQRRRAERIWHQRFQFVWYQSFPVTVLLILTSVIVALLCTDWRNSIQRHGLFAPLCNRDESKLLDALFIQPLAGFENTTENGQVQVVFQDGEPRIIVGRDPRLPDLAGLLSSAQLWRPVTPIFLHFGLLHIGFNMSWMWTLGRQIEFLRGSTRYGLLVLLIAVISNFAQLYWAGPGFGGMSGVVFGLVGYAWMKGRTFPQHGIGMPYDQMVYSVLFLFLCMMGVFGGIANAAHFAGFVTGICCGLRSAALKKLRQYLRQPPQ